MTEFNISEEMQKLFDKAEELDWGCLVFEETYGGHRLYAELRKHSPAGEDFSATIDFEEDNQVETFLKSLREYAEEFDVNEHVELWIPGMGKGGCPSTIKELVEDAEEIKKMLKELSDLLDGTAHPGMMRDKILSVELQIKVTQEDIDDIMTGALEGGITYWCHRVSVVGGEYLGDAASEQISRGGSLKIYDAEDECVHILNLEKLLNGIRLWAKDPVGCNCLEQLDGMLRIDCGNADAVVCDSIIQYALFGEVIYG